MASGKEIRTKIGSIKNTQKITRAMEMVAASKMRKTQERMKETRPYATKMAQIIKHLAQANPEYKHPYLFDRPEKKVGLIVVTSDRGLCGGLNANLFRTVIPEIKKLEDAEKVVDICAIGRKGAAFFSNIGANIVAQSTKLGDSPHLEVILGSIKVMLDEYDNGKIDSLSVVYNEFVNTMTQQPSILKLLPIHTEEIEEDLKGHWDYIYEPDAKEVLDSLLTRYIESMVYQSVVENNACEQAARMVAMKSATDNAGKLIDEFQLLYNKERQAAITQEISEIVGGAAAV